MGEMVETLVSLLGTLFYVLAVVYTIIAIILIAAYWKMYEKAGQPGWACLVPIYNIIVLLKIVKKPLSWIILLLIPFVNIIYLIKLTHATSVVFGKGVGFTLGLLFFPYVFYPLLGFGEAEYQG